MPKQQVESLFRYMSGVIAGKPGGMLVKENHILETDYTPNDVLSLFDRLFDAGFSVDELKIPSNKLFNLLHEALDRFPSEDIKPDSFLSCIIEDNRRLENLLKETRPLILKLNSQYGAEDVAAITSLIEQIQHIHNHYVVKENALFPVLEEIWPEHQCLKLMWSYHDDIRKTIKEALTLLARPELNVSRFNAVTGELFFSVFTILYREEKVLIPHILQTIDDSVLENLLIESAELGFSFLKEDEIKLPPGSGKETGNTSIPDGSVSLSTGKLSFSQLEMLFDFLPVDITYVDENDTVLFYSDPPHRIFPRSKSVIGRKVQNCHPPESLHIVEKILKAFRNGEKEEASFVIRMGPKYIQIRYFAIRNEEGEFKGTLEVSQDVTAIREIDGESRLLDWE
ncbi:MAG: DUF438 domain-containing protein [Spirochaetaceae bacterium]|nr:DUF438 domain-containing protein [Spirochaetaceae bacterium]